MEIQEEFSGYNFFLIGIERSKENSFSTQEADIGSPFGI